MQTYVMQYRFLRLWLLLFGSIGLLLLPGIYFTAQPAHAQTDIQLTVTPAFEGNYMPGTWLPLQVALTNDGPAISALLTAAASNSPNRYTQRVELPSGAAKTVTLYVAMEQETRSLLVTVEQAGTAIAEQEIDVRPRPDERLLGIMSNQPLQLALPRRQEMQQLPFVTSDIAPETLPDRAIGLSSLSLLLIADTAPAALTEAQRQAVAGWVAGGGHLIISGGPDAQRTAGELPAALRPATIGSTQQLNPEWLGTFVATPGPANLSGVELEALPGAISVGPDAVPMWVQRDIGAGRVTQLAFNPNQDALREWEAAPVFWDRLLQPVERLTSIAGLEFTTDRFQEQTLTSAIGNLPGLALPPASILFIVLTVYTILIGPGIAIILRRFDRQAWGWIVLPGVALLMTAIGSGLALGLRADQRIVSQATLVEHLYADQVRVRTVIGILTPQDEQLQIHMPPGALARPLRSTTGAYGQIGGVAGDMLQQSETLTVSVQRWEMQGIIVEQQVTFPEVDAHIVFAGDTIQAQVENTTDQRLRDVSIAYGEQLVQFGAIPAGQDGLALWPVATELDDLAHLPGTALSYLMLGPQLDEGRRPGGVADRRVLVREAVINAAVTRGSQSPRIGPLLLAWLEQSPLDISVEAPGAAKQQIALLVTRPVIGGSGAVTLPIGWLRLNPEADGRAVCSGSEGPGITAASPVTTTLQLPNDLATLQTSALTLTLTSERDWPNVGVTTELFNWQQQRWVEFDFDGPGNLQVPEPEPFMQNGQVRLRLDGRIGEAACLFARAQLTGVLP